jgi:hypothetical protein
VGSTLRLREAFLGKERFVEAVGIEFAVAITRLAKHAGIISLFVRFVNKYFRISFANKVAVNINSAIGREDRYLMGPNRLDRRRMA